MIKGFLHFYYFFLFQMMAIGWLLRADLRSQPTDWPSKEKINFSKNEEKRTEDALKERTKRALTLSFFSFFFSFMCVLMKFFFPFLFLYERMRRKREKEWKFAPQEPIFDRFHSFFSLILSLIRSGKGKPSAVSLLF